MGKILNNTIIGEGIMFFDITSKDNALEFLVNILGVSKSEIMEFVEKVPNSYCIHDFLEAKNIDLKSRSLQNLELIAFHITTNSNECQEIQKYGLLNLQQVLTMDTQLHQYLNQLKIIFDIPLKKLWIDKTPVNIEYKYNIEGKTKKTEKLNKIARKIYSDYQINGFFSIEHEKAYGGNVHERPEILDNLKCIFKNGNEIENTWITKTKAYLVKFKAPLYSFAWYNFYDKEFCYEEDFVEQVGIKNKLIELAFSVIKDFYIHNSSPEIICYLKGAATIPLFDIIEIKEIR